MDPRKKNLEKGFILCMVGKNNLFGRDFHPIGQVI